MAKKGGGSRTNKTRSNPLADRLLLWEGTRSETKQPTQDAPFQKTIHPRWESRRRWAADVSQSLVVGQSVRPTTRMGELQKGSGKIGSATTRRGKKPDKGTGGTR